MNFSNTVQPKPVQFGSSFNFDCTEFLKYYFDFNWITHCLHNEGILKIKHANKKYFI